MMQNNLKSNFKILRNISVKTFLKYLLTVMSKTRQSCVRLAEFS